MAGPIMDRDHIEADGDEQLPHYETEKNRVAYYKNDCEFGWLRNATKKEFSSALFAGVYDGGATAPTALRSLLGFVRSSRLVN